MALKDKQILQYNLTNTQWENTDLPTDTGGTVKIITTTHGLIFDSTTGTLDSNQIGDAYQLQDKTIGNLPTTAGSWIIQYDQSSDTITWVAKPTSGGSYTATSPIVIANDVISLLNTTTVPKVDTTSGYLQTIFTTDVSEWVFGFEGANGRTTSIEYTKFSASNSNTNSYSSLAGEDIQVGSTNSSSLVTIAPDSITVTDGTSTILNTASQISFKDASANEVDITAEGVSISQAPLGGSAATNKTYVDGYLAGHPIVIS